MKCLPILFIIAAFFATGQAIKCYKCNHTSACNDPFTKSGAGVSAGECPSGSVGCGKAVWDSDEVWTTRTCIGTSQFESPSADAWTFLPFKSTHYCRTDYCNGASSIIATQIIFFATAVLFVFTHWQ